MLTQTAPSVRLDLEGQRLAGLELPDVGHRGGCNIVERLLRQEG